MPLNLTLAERIAARSTTLENGCIVTSHCKDSRGYGHMGYMKKHYYVHRVAYELANGPIPHGLTVDHLCRNKSCCNPDHLEIVTRGENTLRGETTSGINSRKTECIRGHALSGDNLQWSGHKRVCRTCKNARRRKKA